METHLSAELWAGLTHHGCPPTPAGRGWICASTVYGSFLIQDRVPLKSGFIFNYLCLWNGFQISLVLEGMWLHPNYLLNPLRYSFPENPMDRGAWQAVVHRVTKSQTRLKWLNSTACSSQGKSSFFWSHVSISSLIDPKNEQLYHSFIHSHTHTPLFLNSFQESCGHLRSFPYFKCCLEFSWKGSQSAKLTSPGPVTYKHLFLLIVTLSTPNLWGSS